MAKENADGQEKTEDPTGKRKSKARSEGQVAKSMEVNFVASLMGAILYFAMDSSSIVMGLKRVLEKSLSNISLDITPITTIHLAGEILKDMLIILLPFMLLLVVVALVANIGQIGFLLTLKPLKPKFSKLNPIKGIKNKFSFKNVGKIFKDTAKVVVIGFVPYLVIKDESAYLPLLMDTSVWAIMCYIGSVIMKMVFYITLLILLIAIIDLIFTRRKHKQDMMMTKHEVKEEHKQAEGDPKVKAKIRQMQLQMILKRMMDDVPKADVVVTNPVHLAVALKYDRADMQAPKVVAKGARRIAERIKQIAKEHGVPIVENRPLAQSLYKLVEIGGIIPDSLFKAVAEVLAYVYSRKNRTAS